MTAAEIEAALAARATENLADCNNATVSTCDAADFDPGECDAMLINAGVTHPHRPWLNRLRLGGRLVLPITTAIPGAQAGGGVMLKVVREAQAFSATVVSMVGIYSCASVRDTSLQADLQKALASRTLIKIRSVRVDDHERTDSCVAHRDDVCMSTSEIVQRETRA